MIDVLLHYYSGTRVQTLAEILAELKPLGWLDEDGGLNAAKAFVVEIETQSAVWTGNPEAPTLVTPRVIEPGIAIWCCCATQAQADALWALTGNVARLMATRETKTVTQTRADPLKMAAAKLVPTVAGSRYIFAGG